MQLLLIAFVCVCVLLVVSTKLPKRHEEPHLFSLLQGSPVSLTGLPKYQLPVADFWLLLADNVNLLLSFPSKDFRLSLPIALLPT